ncbi:MAG TPA: TolC family protein, partial [Rhodospirillaceae bacterium]|nr:TolC family protein [Rhodospirillaceae bacterium]
LMPGTLNGATLPDVSAGLPSELLTRRPDVAYAEAQLVAANANIKRAIASVYPSITLTAQGGVESAALNTLFNPAGTLFSIGAGLAQPLFQGGALEGGIELTEGRLEELTANYQKAVISAFQDVETALAATELTARQEEAQAAAVTTAQHAYEISQAQMFQGTIDIVTLLNVQRTLFQAQDLLVQAKLAHLQAIIGLYRALGGGWDVSKETSEKG